MNTIDLQMKFFKEMTNRGYSQTQIADLWAATQDWIDAGIKPGSLAHLQLIEETLNATHVDTSYMDEKEIL